MPYQQKTVLVVDDQQTMLDLFAKIFSTRGYRVLKALNGEEATSLLNQGVDLMVTDISMPGLKGLDLADLARVNFHIPVIIITGVKAYTPEIVLSHCDRFFQKPVRPGDLLTAAEDLEKISK